MDKNEARKIAKANVARMSDAEREWASAAIVDAVISSHVFRAAHKIFVFSGNSAVEPDTHELIGLALALEKTVALPKIVGDEMIALSVTPYTNFRTNKFGILEPDKGAVIDEFDLVIMPLVAFDSHLNRVGHGKGYYDKYLMGKNVKKLGLAFECQKTDGIDAEPHDVKPDILITEKQLYPAADKMQKNFLYGEQQ